MNQIMILSGSASDQKIIDKVTSVLDSANTPYEVHIASAHREPDKVHELVKQGEKNGIKVFICIAGLSAALPGVVASKTDLPVIGVPVSSALGGLDALLSIAQMPKGVPVAAVGIDNGQNAAHLAMRILHLVNS